MNLDYGHVNAGVMEYAPTAIVFAGNVIINGTAEQYRAAGWLPNENTQPAPGPGEHVKSWAWATDGEKNYKSYEYEADAPAPIMISKTKVEAAVDEMGATAAFMAWLNSRASYIGAWLRGGDTIPYDPTDNASDLLSLMSAIGVPEDQIQGLVERVTE